MYNVDEIISRMMKACCAANPAQMLKSMGFSSGAAAAWKRRGAIPDGSIAKVAERTGVSFQWLKTGEGEMQPAGHSDRAVESLVADAIEPYDGRAIRLTEKQYRLLKMFERLDPDRQQDILDRVTDGYIIKMEEGREGN